MSETKQIPHQQWKEYEPLLRQIGQSTSIPDSTLTVAEDLTRQYIGELTKPGYRREVIIIGIVYTAVRIDQVQIQLADIIEALSHNKEEKDDSRVPSARVRKVLPKIQRVLEIPVPPERPRVIVGAITDKLSTTRRSKRCAREVCDVLNESDFYKANSPAPSGIAGAIVYEVLRQAEWDEKQTQTTVANAADISEVTIRKQRENISRYVSTTLE
jgi:transcription initiation factor TFIIIB Brf1 subunit/transcription initiation factor TFIIB